MLIDTHAHLDLEEFDADRDDVISRAMDAGVAAIINPGIDLNTSKKAIVLSETYASVYAAVGIHPNRSASIVSDDIVHITRLADHPRVVAIGEAGLDFYRDRSPRETQIKVFRAHLELAKKLSLPVIIHFRNVDIEGIELVGADSFNGLRGVFHCFGGSLEFARKIIDMGFYIGFDGPLTYPKSDRVDIACKVPLNRCLIETDAPFLAPQSHRGKRNESAYVQAVAAKLADTKQIALEEVIVSTGKNACELFGIDISSLSTGQSR